MLKPTLPEASETHLQNAERALAGATDDETRALPGAIALIRATNAQLQGNLAAAVTSAALAIQRLAADDGYLRAQAAITLESNRTLAREQLQLAQDRYRIGQGTALEVADAQNAVTQAEADYVSAVYDYHQAVVALEAAVGRPLR